MTAPDDIILEFLDESGTALNKRGLEINLKLSGYKVSYSTIKRRLPKLEEAGLIKSVDDSGPWYQITERGKQFLEGNLDLRDFDDPQA